MWMITPEHLHRIFSSNHHGFRHHSLRPPPNH
uniref:Uncharacterized protein n=1 Tax=Arundo donax TaxID=35708 RepID=A0A0A9BTP5_ARUDO